MQTWRRLLGFACLQVVVALLPLRLPGQAFTISTIAGGEDGPATSIPLGTPGGVAVDANGNLYNRDAACRESQAATPTLAETPGKEPRRASDRQFTGGPCRR